MHSIDLAPDEKEAMQQLFFNGPTWDGDLVSKAGRTGLVDRGYAERCNGWQQLTSAGFEVAVRAGLGDDKERRDIRRRREDNDKHRLLCGFIRDIGGSIVVPQDMPNSGLSIERGKDGTMRFAFGHRREPARLGASQDDAVARIGGLRP